MNTVLCNIAIIISGILKLHNISYQIGIYHLLCHILWYYLQHEWLWLQYFGLCSPTLNVYKYHVHCITCWSMSVFKGLVTTPIAWSLVANGGRNIQIDFPEPVAMQTHPFHACQFTYQLILVDECHQKAFPGAPTAPVKMFSTFDSQSSCSVAASRSNDYSSK